MIKGNDEYYDIEPVCYERSHVEAVSDAVRGNFHGYFPSFLQDGSSVHSGRGRQSDREAFKDTLRGSIDGFEKDRESYLRLMDPELLEEYEEDPDLFKNTELAKRCPIIRRTLNSKDEALQKYKQNWRVADPEEMREAVSNLCSFAAEHRKRELEADTYDEITMWYDMGMDALDDDQYKVPNVIGGSIRTRLLYKLDPEFFPNMSRNAVWAMWFLSGQQPFGCSTDSEFVMIDREEGLVQQNYFYPYGLFAYYAYEIYRLLRAEAEALNVYIDPAYRYVAVDAFLEHVTKMHSAAIRELSHDTGEEW